MRMVIFGAGASRDAVTDSPLTPGRRLPLAAELFSKSNVDGAIARKYPPSISIIDRLSEKPRSGESDLIEARLGALQQRAGSDPEIARQLMALRFYLSDFIRSKTAAINEDHAGFTNYVRLLRKIGDWRSENDEQVVLVTFNYDTLIDEALESQLGNINLHEGDNLDHMTQWPDWKLVKLHGSANWSRCVPWKTAGQQFRSSPWRAIAVADELDLTQGDIQCVSADGTRDASSKFYVPALAVPTDEKSTFECPPSHQAVFESAVAETTSLLIVGWKAQEKNVLSTLSKLPASASIGIVDYAEAGSGNAFGVRNVQKNLGAEVVGGRMIHGTNGGFSGFLRHGHAEAWLSDQRWNQPSRNDDSGLTEVFNFTARAAVN